MTGRRRGAGTALPAGERSARRPTVSVALPLPVYHTFTYEVTGPVPEIGTRVLVPFRDKARIGWVVGHGGGETLKKIRPILDVVEDAPSLPLDLLALCEWMADYYVSPLGVVIAATQPAVLSDVSRDVITRTGPTPEGSTPRAARLADILEEHPDGVRVATLRKSLAMGSIWPEIRFLQAAGALRHETIPPPPPPVRYRRAVEIVAELPTLEVRESAFGRAARQREAFETLEASGGSADLGHLTGQGFSRSVITGLEDKGLVQVIDREVIRDPFADAPTSDVSDPPPLTVDQEVAVAALQTAAAERKTQTFLLHGITGSGKTRVYIELLRDVIAQGRGAIVLVPEISLTPQTVRRFRDHFGDRIAVLHSALSDGERYDAWRQLARGEKTVAVGARSALFAPIADIGAIVVDEEHDGSYKQSEAPRYNARDLAVVRAGQTGAVCVLGSATPSLESWANVQKGKFTRLHLPKRVGTAKLPPVELIDLRELRKAQKAAKLKGGEEGASEAGTILSPQLIEAVTLRLQKQEQVILLLNRRGYASFVQCRECGDVRLCENCSISLTYHRGTGRLVCHHCRFEEPAPQRCTQCGSADLNFRGLGTEQVERVVMNTFPSARVARMDVDTTTGKWAHHEILGRVERGEVDILLGTQMIAKGLDFPRVTLVGVINADVGIHLPDFRASERTFQLLAQVAGRAGRGTLGGQVLIQTLLPDHYALEAARTHDYESFAERELKERLNPSYAPHVRMVNVVLSSPDSDLAADQATAAVQWIDRWIARNPGAGVERVGPAPSPIERLHTRWRWHFLLRAAHSAPLGAICRAFMEGFQPRGGDIRVALDRDPVALL